MFFGGNEGILNDFIIRLSVTEIKIPGPFYFHFGDDRSFNSEFGRNIEIVFERFDRVNPDYTDIVFVIAGRFLRIII